MEDKQVPLIGLALAGHSFRVSGDEKKSQKYDNELTDFINLTIAKVKAKESMANNANS